MLIAPQANSIATKSPRAPINRIRHGALLLAASTAIKPTVSAIDIRHALAQKLLCFADKINAALGPADANSCRPSRPVLRLADSLFVARPVPYHVSRAEFQFLKRHLPVMPRTRADEIRTVPSANTMRPILPPRLVRPTQIPPRFIGRPLAYRNASTKRHNPGSSSPARTARRTSPLSPLLRD